MHISASIKSLYVFIVFQGNEPGTMPCKGGKQRTGTRRLLCHVIDLEQLHHAVIFVYNATLGGVSNVNKCVSLLFFVCVCVCLLILNQNTMELARFLDEDGMIQGRSDTRLCARCQVSDACSTNVLVCV